MIYYVSNEKPLISYEDFKYISVQESLELLNKCNVLQYDSESTGRDPHINKLLCIQFGSKKYDFQIVIDVTTVSILLYKDILESKLIIGQNLKFDIKFLYNYGIIPLKIYDTMIVEQLIYLAYPKGMYPTNLQALCHRYLNIYLDKTVRGQIIWRELDYNVIKYAALDVTYLEDIMKLQLDILRKRKELKAAKVECDFVPVCAYYEWCGIKLDVNKWTDKMKSDKEKLDDATKKLNDFVIKTGNSKFYNIDYQGDLFTGFNLEPKCTINWQSSKKVIPFLTYLGFNCKGLDKKTKEEKDSIEEKVLRGQKGINDEFLDIYFSYTEAAKTCSTYGINYLNAINPNTGRIHTEFRALGTDTGRLACGSQQINTDLAKLKGLPITKTKDKTKICAYPQFQNLPNDKITRSCIVSEKENLMISCDYSGEESRLLASLSNDEAMLKIFREGLDMHSYVAWLIYPDKIPRDTPIQDIKKLYKHLRQEAKGPEFCFAFLGNWATLVANYGMSKQEAQDIERYYKEGFSGATKFQENCKKFTSSNGYIVICEETGHKAYWWDWEDWHKRQTSNEFWDNYKIIKASGNEIPDLYKEHFAAKSKWDKNSVNSRTQGLGAVIFKIFNYEFFKWVIENNLFNKVKFCVPVHDEIVLECPKEIVDKVKTKLQSCMSEVGERFCHRLPMPTEAEIDTCWRH